MKSCLTVLCLFIASLCLAQKPADHYEKAKELFDAGDYRNALKEVQASLKTGGYDSEKCLFMASVLEHLEQFQKAYETYSMMLEKDPNDMGALNQRGLLLSKVQDFDASLADFNRAIAVKSPDSIRVMLHVNRGAVRTSVRNFFGAYEDLMVAYKIDSMQVGILNNLAMVCDEIGKGDQTLKYLFRVIEIDSQFVGAYSNIGFKYHLMGEYKKAITYFDKVLELDPEEALGYSNRAYSKCELGDLAGALKDVNKGIELYPANSYAFKVRALVYIKMKDLTKGCNDLDQALTLGYENMYGTEVAELKQKYCGQKSL